MFGCDFPVLRYEKVVADWKSEGYPQEVLEKVLYRNAEAYFSLRPDRRSETHRPNMRANGRNDDIKALGCDKSMWRAHAAFGAAALPGQAPGA